MRKSPGRRLTLNFFSLSFVQAISSLLQLLVIPYLIIIIGAEGFGVIAVAQVLMFYLSTLTEFGFNQTATRAIALNREEGMGTVDRSPGRPVRQEGLSAVFSRVYATRWVLGFFALIILVLLVAILPLFREHALIYLTGFAFVIGQTCLVNWFFLGMEQMWYMALFHLLGRVLFVLAVFLFIKSPGDSWVYLFSLGAGNIIAGMLSLLFIKKRYGLKPRGVRVSAIGEELRGGWQYTLTNLSMNTCQYINIFILRLFTNDLVVGYFAIAERIYFVAKQVLGIFSQSAYPAVCNTLAAGRDALQRFWRSNYLPFLLVVAGGCLFTWIFAAEILELFLYDEAFNAVFYLRMFCLTTLVICLNIPGSLYLLAAERKRLYFRIFMLAGLINVIANILLAWQWQSTGTVVAILLTEVFVTIAVTAALPAGAPTTNRDADSH